MWKTILVRKAYLLLLIEALLFFIPSFNRPDDVKFCLNIGDTYYVTSGEDFYLALSIISLFFGFLYWLFDFIKFRLNSWLSCLHIYSLLIAFPLLVYFNYKDSKTDTFLIFEEYNSFFNYDRLVIIALGFIIFIQILFFINIFASLIKKSSVHSTSKRNE